MNKLSLGILLCLSLVIFAVIDVISGSVSIPFQEFKAWISGSQTSEVFNLIVLQSRVPKALTAILVGAAL